MEKVSHKWPGRLGPLDSPSLASKWKLKFIDIVKIIFTGINDKDTPLRPWSRTARTTRTTRTGRRSPPRLGSPAVHFYYLCRGVLTLFIYKFTFSTSLGRSDNLRPCFACVGVGGFWRCLQKNLEGENWAVL